MLEVCRRQLLWIGELSPTNMYELRKDRMVTKMNFLSAIFRLDYMSRAIHGESLLREPLVFIVQLLNKPTQSDKI